MSLRAVIFDFDGVIADTEHLHYLAFERLLEPEGLGVSWETYVETCIGFDDRDVFRYRYQHDPAHLENGVLETYVAAKAKAFLDLVKEKGAPVYPGVERLIRDLQAAAIPIGLCSGAVRTDIDAILRSTSFADAFLVQVTADDVERSKPDPEGYCAAARRLLGGDELSIPPGIVAIEDTPAGLSSAMAAGLSTLAVTTTHDAAALRDARRIVASLEDVRLADFERLVDDSDS